MSDTGYLLVLGRCYGCAAPFSFDPETVPSVFTVDGVVPPDGPVPDGAVRQPLCDNCVERIERVRAEAGLPPGWPNWRRTS